MLSCDQKNYLVALVLLTIALMMVGCGGGGGKSNIDNPAQNPPIVETTFQVDAKNINKTIGNVEFSAPAGTFAQGATVTVRLTSPNHWEGSSEVNVIGNEIEISSTVQPTGDITLTTSNDQTKSSQFLYYPLSFIEGKWEKVGQAILEVDKIKASISANKLVPKGMLYSLKFILARIEIDSPDSTEIGFLPIAGPENFEDRAVILVHGINSTAKSMNKLGQTLVQKGLYKSAWSLSYDWRLPTNYVAAQLKQLINGCVHNNTQIDLIGHSRGGLICRYACEILGANESVGKLILICSPNEGSRWDSAIDLVPKLEDHFFNTSSSSGFPLVDTPAVQELTQDSDIVQTLKVYHGYKSEINYYLFATRFDPFVSTDSALAEGTNIDAFTSSSVIRNTLFGDHSSLTSDPDGIESLVNILAQ